MSEPTTSATLITHVSPETELVVLDTSVRTTDGQSNWVYVVYGDAGGYVRRDLVSSPHTPSLPTVTPP